MMFLSIQLYCFNIMCVYNFLLQVVDNHVVNYTPPEEYTPRLRVPRFLRDNIYGCLLVGAESMDPQMVNFCC